MKLKLAIQGKPKQLSEMLRRTAETLFSEPAAPEFVLQDEESASDRVDYLDALLFLDDADTGERVVVEERKEVAGVSEVVRLLVHGKVPFPEDGDQKKFVEFQRDCTLTAWNESSDTRPGVWVIRRSGFVRDFEKHRAAFAFVLERIDLDSEIDLSDLVEEA